MSESGDHVADTHSLIWHLTESAMLSALARAILLEADASIVVPSVVMVEIISARYHAPTAIPAEAAW